MRKRRGEGDSGFTLLEVLIVLAIIGTLAAVALPNVMEYMKFYRIRGASQQVVGAIQEARVKAIGKSPNWGTVFVIRDQRTYWVHLEDLQAGVPGPNYRGGAACAPQGPTSGALNNQCLDGILAANRNPPHPQTTQYTLPDRVVFAASTAECTTTPLPVAPGFNPTDAEIRFNRLGATCDPDADPLRKCSLATLTNGAVISNRIDNRATDSMICLRLLDAGGTPTGIARWITIARGGRVEEQR